MQSLCNIIATETIRRLDSTKSKARLLLDTNDYWDVCIGRVALYPGNLETRRTQQFKTFMYKTVNNMVPSNLSRKFTPTSMIHEHNC